MIGSITDEIKQRVDVVEFISRYTQLKRAGSIYKGTCPFHNERTPSFVVFPHTGTWHCFGACGTGGDIISFVMRRENLNFREAVEVLARQAGIDLAEQEEDDSGRQRTRIYTANDTACGYYEHVLWNHPAAEPARAYLARRGIDRATAEHFRLGFALDGWSGLRDFLLAKNLALDLLLEAGLVKRNEERNSTYDMFRGRVIFPIRDRQARVIGFGGRVLDDGVPKYLNTAETPLFHKSHVIYGLDLAHRALRDRDQVVIVEGYMDVIAAHQFGFDNVVACMGTALTPEQLRQLQHYTDNFVLALDADAAGQQATIRGLNQARQSLTRVRKPVVTPGGVRLEDRLGANLAITTMPLGKDPDEVIRTDPAQWEQAVAAAKPLVDFYFDIVAAHEDLTSARGKGQAVAELTPLIAELGDEIERQHYVQRLSRLVQVDEMTIAGRVQAAARTQAARTPPPGRSQEPGRNQEPARGRPGGRTTPGSSQNAGRALDRALNEDGPPPWEQDTPLAEPTRSQLAGARPGQAPGAGRFEQEDHLLANLLSEANLLVWLSGATERLTLDPVSAEDWHNVENRELFGALKLYLASDEPWDLELFQEMLAPPLHGRLAHLLSYAARVPQDNPLLQREDAVKVLVRMRIEQLKQEMTNIKFLLTEMQGAGEQDAVRSFFRINDQHSRELSHLQRVMARLQLELFQRARSEKGLKIN